MFDVILHKLTEDILCLSQMEMERQRCPVLRTIDGEPATRTITAAVTAPPLVPVALPLPRDENQILAAVHRVQRLVAYRRRHPGCAVVDDPVAVQTLMSRADIAVALQTCLCAVRTASGCPVGAPAYAVLLGTNEASSSLSLRSVEEQVRHLSFPIIVKPLTAAGTKSSHAMAVLMNPTALTECLAVKLPCLCQEYSNHDAILYKVYVLGTHVSVHQRRSLPNLPRHGNTSSSSSSALSYVEFDSQRPYPRLADFGVAVAPPPPPLSLRPHGSDERRPGDHKRPRDNGFAAADDDDAILPSAGAEVTADEVKPIVDALKKAFGLELFGFDILITTTVGNGGSSGGGDGRVEGTVSGRKMLVVDVNYFPSYKEVPDFPALLANYLADRAMECRWRGRQR